MVRMPAARASGQAIRWRIGFAALLLCLWAGVAGAGARQGGSSAADQLRKILDRPRVPLDVREGPGIASGDLRIEHVTFASEAGVRVPALIVRLAQESGPKGAVICLHGLGGSKESMRSLMDPLARRGLVAVAIDARYHGDRKGDLRAALVDAFKGGKEHPYVYDTVWDTWRTIDYLETRKDVARDRIGVCGISLGGHTTWMATADPRVRAAVPCISVCSWRWQLDHQGYGQRVRNLQGAYDGVAAALGEPEVNRRVVEEAWRRWTPGIPDRFDCQDVLASMPPRPLLILNGDSDPVAPLEGQRVVYRVLERAYHDAGAVDRLKIVVAEKTGHQVTGKQREALVEWFARWLG